MEQTLIINSTENKLVVLLDGWQPLDEDSPEIEDEVPTSEKIF